MDDKVIWLVIKLPNIYDDGIHITKAFDSISAAQRYAAELNDTCFKNTDAKEPFTVERVEHRQEPATLQSNLGTYSMRVRSADGSESLPAPWTGDNIPPNARIKDLDCSTPKTPEEVFVNDGPFFRATTGRVEPDESPKDWVENLKEGIANGQKYAEQMNDIEPRASTRIESVVLPNTLAESQHDAFFGAPYLSKGKQPFHTPVLTEHGKTPPNTAVPGDWKNAATLESGTGGPAVEIVDREADERKALGMLKYAKGVTLESLSDFVKQTLQERQSRRLDDHFSAFPIPKFQPMTLERAVAVLNEQKYQGYDNWHLGDGDKIGMGAYEYGVMVYGISHYEGTAVAEKLEHEK